MKKEIELKYCLSSKEDFVSLMHFLEHVRREKSHTYHQENSYFDSPNLILRREGISLRLRKQNGDFILSAKQSLPKKKSSKNLSVRLEYEGMIEKHIAALLCNNNLSPVDAFAFLKTTNEDELATKKILYRRMKKAAHAGLQIIGSFKNTRISIPIVLAGEDIVLEFDHSFYPKGIEIFEVEVEFSSIKQATALRPAMDALFRMAGIKTHRSSSKSSRLYKILFR